MALPTSSVAVVTALSPVPTSSNWNGLLSSKNCTRMDVSLMHRLRSMPTLTSLVVSAALITTWFMMARSQSVLIPLFTASSTPSMPCKVLPQATSALLYLKSWAATVVTSLGPLVSLLVQTTSSSLRLLPSTMTGSPRSVPSLIISVNVELVSVPFLLPKEPSTSMVSPSRPSTYARLLSTALVMTLAQQSLATCSVVDTLLPMIAFLALFLAHLLWSVYSVPSQRMHLLLLASRDFLLLSTRSWKPLRQLSKWPSTRLSLTSKVLFVHVVITSSATGTSRNPSTVMSQSVKQFQMLGRQFASSVLVPLQVV
mmetsp:Transcript_903/g.2097  ORF Transcript_903/g.2097 Transcript_903/m.2097 type:complete len:312 (-) Transcript_903:1344-2279(-)